MQGLSCDYCLCSVNCCYNHKTSFFVCFVLFVCLLVGFVWFVCFFVVVVCCCFLFVCLFFSWFFFLFVCLFVLFCFALFCFGLVCFCLFVCLFFVFVFLMFVLWLYPHAQMFVGQNHYFFSKVKIVCDIEILSKRCAIHTYIHAHEHRVIARAHAHVTPREITG